MVKLRGMVCRGNMSHRTVSLFRRFQQFLRQHGPVRHLGCTRGSTRSQNTKLQVDAPVKRGAQKRDVFADVTSGSPTAISCPGIENCSSTLRPSTPSSSGESIDSDSPSSMCSIR